jgi:hypothetical protein
MTQQGKYVKVKCEECGEEFERFYCHPYITKCKKCRKGDKKVGAKPPEPQTKVNSDNGKDFQFLKEWGIKVNACCFDTMKRMLDNGKPCGGKIECRCGFQFRKLSTNQVGIGLARYRLENDKLVLEKDYRKGIKK